MSGCVSAPMRGLFSTGRAPETRGRESSDSARCIIPPMHLILTHDQADFDAVGAVLAARLLEPEALAVLLDA